MKVLKFPKLNDGDTVGVIAPSHPVQPFQKMYDRGIANLKAFGFRVKEDNDLAQPGRVKDMTSEVKKVILEITDEYDFPILASADFGHCTPDIPLPLGLKASMGTEEVKLSIDESYVK